jgi:hypothetical protein
MLTSLHFLLTYSCNSRCDHCFLHCGPSAGGTFTAAQLREAMDQAAELGSVTRVYMEGGEAFLYYPLMIEGIRLARERGFEAGVVTNAFWATTVEDAKLWLAPLAEMGVVDVSVSDDAYHFGDVELTPARIAQRAARELGIPVGAICIEKPIVIPEVEQSPGKPIVGGGVRFRGRAVGLTPGLPTLPWNTFASCPYEDLRSPGRVHPDMYGHVQLCQGISMGNMWESPLSELVASYDPDAHPIVGPLLRGGPLALAEEHGLEHEPGYVDACHFCYLTRVALVDRYPQYLGPRQVYGI